jgi:hypothetical protein
VPSPISHLTVSEINRGPGRMEKGRSHPTSDSSLVKQQKEGPVSLGPCKVTKETSVQGLVPAPMAAAWHDRCMIEGALWLTSQP